MEKIQIWHPHPDTMKWMHLEQHTSERTRIFYTDGAEVLRQTIDQSGFSDVLSKPVNEPES